jgi:hypothetical protein
MTLQQQSLEHVLTLLEGFNTFALRGQLNASLQSNKAPDGIITDAMRSIDGELDKLNKIVIETRKWVYAVVQDMDKNNT